MTSLPFALVLAALLGGCPSSPPPVDCLDADGDGTCDPLGCIDADGDGICDDREPCAGDGDADGDGICNAVDICPGFDDTHDFDGDGVPNGCDACPADPGAQVDDDGDGVCNAVDICPGHPDLSDFDGDGQPDGCDPCPLDDPDDSDGDGLCDSDDACPGSPDDEDADGDGVPDACDPCPLDDPDDSDGDGLCDSDDPWPDLVNAFDFDGDGVPDGADPCPLDDPDDSDGDGSCDTDDLCPGADDTVDGDGDGVPDACDPCPLDNPDDSDGDGVCDTDDRCPGGHDGFDLDDDGTPDACDTCPLDNPDDSDGDGTCDLVDLCPGHDDFEDTDADGVPDGCDRCPLDTADDSDGDGVCDSDDPCPQDYPDDTDLDGVCDSDDPCPLDAADDSDGDGVCDSDDPCPFDNPDDQNGDGACDSDVTFAPVITEITPAFGSAGGGYLVQIVGENFLAGVKVEFGKDGVGWARASGLRVLNAGTLIQVLAPPFTAGLVDVVVTNTDGRSTTVVDAFEYIAPVGLPDLEILDVLPERGPADGGYLVTIAGKGFVDGVQVFWGDEARNQWTPSPSVERFGPTMLRAVMPTWPADETVDLKVVQPSVTAETVDVLRDAFTFGPFVVFDAHGQRLPNDLVHGDDDVVLFDANGDGLTDVFVLHGSRIADELYLQTFDGAGNLGFFVDRSADIGPPPSTWRDRGQAHDVDGDGDLDLVHVTYQGIGVWRNDGAGGFTWDRIYDGSSGRARDFAFADLDCDTLPDLVIAHDDRPNVILVGDGAGGFTEAPDVLPGESEPSEAVAVADVDDDGDLDILVANDDAVQNRLYYNNCANTDPSSWAFVNAEYGTGRNFPTSGFSTKDALFQDVDGDGWADAVLVNDGQSLRIYLNDGSGNFANDDGTRFPQSEDNPNAIEGWFVDLDTDGDQDLILLKRVANGATWPDVYFSDLAQGGNGTYTNVSALNVPAWRGEDTRTIAVGDLDDDRLPDLYLLQQDNPDWLFINDGFKEDTPIADDDTVGVGVLANNTSWAFPEDAYTVTDVQLGDIDGDGDLDVFLGHEQADVGPTLWINDGTGQFFDQTGTRLPPIDGCRLMDSRFADLNGDGDLDLMFVCTNFYDGRNWWPGRIVQWVNDGNGFFTDRSVENEVDAGNRYYTAIELADIDGDGDLDAIVGIENGAGKLLLSVGDAYGNDGALYLERGGRIPDSFSRAWSILGSDLNQDGAVDLYVGTGGQNLVYYNDGAGFFEDVTATHLPAIRDNTWTALTWDLDEDGDNELYVVNNGTNRLHVGELDFKFADATATALPPQESANNRDAGLIDVDGDGLLDLITGVYGRQNTLYVNTGGAQFDDFTVDMPPDADHTTAIAVGDLDGNGEPDLFVGNRLFNRIYLNFTRNPGGR